jgi:nicotinate-nucleotide pyrophosphorylase (carboxylating)
MRPALLEPPAGDVRAAVERALAEDLTPLGDLTAAILPPDATTVAQFTAREAGRLAGIPCAGETFVQVDPSVQVQWLLRDGAILEPGDVIGIATGALASILVAERTALNFMGHLSGIATRVSLFVAEADGKARIWDTRKTTPGLRSLEKAAVRAGGGHNHRGNLSDWIMIKDNHLTGMSVTQAVEAARDRWPARTVQVECDTLDQMIEAIEAGADLLLLDNMTPDQIRECVTITDTMAATGAKRPLLEASGGIKLETVAGYANAGIDLMSSGALTNSAPVLDIGLDIGPVVTADH